MAGRRTDGPTDDWPTGGPTDDWPTDRRTDGGPADDWTDRPTVQPSNRPTVARVDRPTNQPVDGRADQPTGRSARSRPASTTTAGPARLPRDPRRPPLSPALREGPVSLSPGATTPEGPPPTASTPTGRPAPLPSQLYGWCGWEPKSPAEGRAHHKHPHAPARTRTAQPRTSPANPAP
ncbi:hypothetical protein [Streptomyces sp. NPDC055912]|uniref:hypothetical protein n=1 Tax=Streptomyces sp. NPDC055912 TaxID=3345660 RepID=UPI0035D751F1